MYLSRMQIYKLFKEVCSSHSWKIRDHFLSLRGKTMVLKDSRRFCNYQMAYKIASETLEVKLPKSDFLKELKVFDLRFVLLCKEGLLGLLDTARYKKMYRSYIVHLVVVLMYAIPTIYLLLDLPDRKIKREHCCPWFC